MDDEKPKSGRELGLIGEAVRDNVKRARGRMAVTELSRRMSDLGRPIPAIGIRRIEDGTRRVDVDDLVALAVALHVSPVSLLIPPSAWESPSAVVAGTATEEMPAEKLVAWLRAQAPLPEQRDSAPRAWSLPQWLIDREDQLASSDIDWQSQLQMQITALTDQVRKLQARGDS